MNEEIILKSEDGVGIITLNRPERLNALTYNIVQKMNDFLDKCESDDDIKCVIIEGAGEKAFCAGGDVVSLRKQVLDEGGPPTELSEKFFYDEYLLNYKINNFTKPYIALIDGVTMGGGVGVSMHGSHIVCTERTMFAMPETTIGLFPDVGGGWLLAQLPITIGLWLALTGARLKSIDLMKTGLSNYYIESKNIQNLKNEIFKNPSKDHQQITNLIDKFSGQISGESIIEKNQVEIKEIFEQENIEEILNKTYSLSQNGSEFSKNTEHELKGKSPTSLKITFKQIHMATEMSLRDALIMEYRMVQRCQASGDFYEGVRAMLVDKDRNPQWKPSNLDKVDEIWVNHFFEPLHEKDLKI